MNGSDLLKRYLDAGIQFTQLTQRRAEAIVRDLVKAGEVQADQAQALVSDLVDRSRQNTEKLLDQVRAEIRQQFKALGVATKDDIARLERRIDDVRKASGAGGAARRRAPAKKTAAKKAPAKKAAATKKS